MTMCCVQVVIGCVEVGLRGELDMKRQTGFWIAIQKLVSRCRSEMISYGLVTMDEALEEVLVYMHTSDALTLTCDACAILDSF